MLTDSDIETILRFTGGELQVCLNPAVRIIEFNQPGVRFELITSSENPILALFISTDGPLVHYEIPIERLEETRKSDQPGGIQMLPNLSFFGGERGRRLLSLTKHGNRFTVDPIWDGNPAQKTNS